MGIKIITDSASDLDFGTEKKYDITVVPLTVNFGDKSYKDRIEISSSEFFDKLSKFDGVPTTSQVTPGEFVDTFKPIIENGDEIIGIFISSSMSGTYNSAMVAKEMLGSDKISIVDSKMVTLGEALLVYRAAQLVEEGLSRDEIVKKLNTYINQMKTFMIVDTLEYLKKGGRLSANQAFIGGMLNLKPIITFEDGNLVSVDKVRGRKKALNWVKKWLNTNNVDLSDKPVYLMHSTASDYLEELKEILINDFGAREVIESTVGAVVGTHAGPGAIAFSFIDE